MTYYNLSFMDNTTNIAQIAVGVNDASNGWLFGLVLLILWVLMYMVFKDYETKSMMTGINFLTSLLAGVLFAAGLLPWWALTIPTIAFFISLVILLWGD